MPDNNHQIMRFHPGRGGDVSIAIEVPDNSELIMRFHPVGGDDVSIATKDFGGERQALEAVARAMEEGRGLVLAQARYNGEIEANGVVINLANVVSVRVSIKDSAATGQYL